MLCYHFSCIMGPPRICPHCGVVLKDRCALYTHIIDVHDRRFCLYCDQEEGKPSRMRRHIRKRHHVDVSLDEEPHRPAHVAVRPIPPAPSCVPDISQMVMPPRSAKCLPLRMSVLSFLGRRGVPRPHVHPPLWLKTVHHTSPSVRIWKLLW